jgi:glutamine amidotransferase
MKQQHIAIIKYNAGNIRSVDHALRRLGMEAEITDKPEKIIAADKVIFPGVGEAGTTMAYLQSRGLDRLIASLRQPVLGICLGQQLMCAWSEERNTPCIGIFDQPVKHFPGDQLKVPHMGWNGLRDLRDPLFIGVPEGSYVYFVHSYYVPACADTAALCDYILPFSAALQKDNFFATQFHPEKSGDPGHRILSNFLAL